MHPLIKDFIETGDRLSVILEKCYNKDQYLETVFIRLLQAFYHNNVEPQLYLDLDQAILKGHPDTGVYLLFISFSITFTGNHGQFERANVIHSIGTSLFREKLHPLLQSYFNVMSASLKLCEGKSAESNCLIKEAIQLVDAKSPRYITIFGNVASLLANQGRLKELSKEELKLLDPPFNKNYEFPCINTKLSNLIQTGNFKEGFVALEEFKKEMIGGTGILLQDRIDLLNILSGDFDVNNYQEDFFKLFACACKLLSLGDWEGAKKYSQILKKRNWEKVGNMKIDRYIHLHLELCLGNKGKARLLLQEIEQKLNPHYLDDFFLARIQLLEMNTKSAYETFRRLIENINKYDAINRLVFELQFAKEMKPVNILTLMNGINNKNNLIIANHEKTESVISVLEEKGIQLLVGGSEAITQVKKLVKKFAKLKEPVLITGETGTGKELISRAIHEEGLNPKEPFLAINCGALTDALLQSELFGYEAGAFTGAQKEHKGIFEAAGKGTVFLDEFGEISQKLQTSLLRVLESNEIRLIGGTKTRQIECKIVIATNIDLRQAVEEKKFREDLYFRLARFDIKLPPLRERLEDISDLITHFLGDNQKRISSELLDVLIKYRWPGNIRELKNEIERLKVLHPDNAILDLNDFDFTRLQGVAPIDLISNTKKNEDPIEISKQSTVKNNRIINERILKIVQKTSTVDQRQEFLKEIFLQYKKLTKSQIMEIAEISPVTAKKDLQALCDAGFIERKTPTKSVKSNYFILTE